MPFFGFDETPILGHSGVALGHLALHSDRTAYRVDDARRLDEQAIAGGLDDAPAMRVDLGIDQFASMRLQPCKGSFLVCTHEPAVTGDIRGKNGGQPAFDAFCGQSGLPPHGPNGSSALVASYPQRPTLPFSFGETACFGSPRPVRRSLFLARRRDRGSQVRRLSGGGSRIRTLGPSYGDLDRATVQGQPRLATRALVAAPPADRLDLVGVDLHAERKLIAKIIHSLRLVA